MLPSAYNNNFIVAQAPGYVAIYVEMIHDTRIIPLDGRDHVPSGIRQWHGDSRGHWEGDTLVVETTNLRRTEAHAGAAGGDPILLRMANGRTEDTITVTERFTRVDATTLNYEFTIDDPTHWTRPFSGEFPVHRVPGGRAAVPLRVRVPRGELQHGQHPGRRAGAGAGGGPPVGISQRARLLAGPAAEAESS